MKKIYSRFCEIELLIAMIALCVSTVLIFCSSIFRSIGMPINWSLEIALFIFAWCVFLSADVGLRSGRMINMDIFINIMPRKIQICCMILSYSIIIVFLCAMVGFGFYLSYETRIRSFLGIPNFSYTWITLSLPVSSLFMLVTSSLKVCGFVQELKAQFSDSSGGSTGKEPASLI